MVSCTIISMPDGSYLFPPLGSSIHSFIHLFIYSSIHLFISFIYLLINHEIDRGQLIVLIMWD
jgi:hypothetical protein